MSTDRLPAAAAAGADCTRACSGLVGCSLQQFPVGSHTGHKWAELLFATGQTGSSTAKATTRAFPQQNRSLLQRLVLNDMQQPDGATPQSPRVPEVESWIMLEIKTRLTSGSFVS